MISDSAGSEKHAGNQVTICITSTDAKELESVFKALQQNGKVNVLFQKTSSSPGFGNITDNVWCHVSNDDTKSRLMDGLKLKVALILNLGGFFLFSTIYLK